MLHVTNGESVSLAETGLGGEVLCWRDSLHGDGEPAELNAGEIVLWFEHDLFDQAQLIEILARLQGTAGRQPDFHGSLSGNAHGGAIARAVAAAARGHDREYGLGQRLGRRFAAGDMAAIQGLLAGDTFGIAVSGGCAAAALAGTALGGERPGEDGASDSGDRRGRRTYVPHAVPGAGGPRGADIPGRRPACGTGFVGWWSVACRYWR